MTTRRTRGYAPVPIAVLPFALAALALVALILGMAASYGQAVARPGNYEIALMQKTARATPYSNSQSAKPLPVASTALSPSSTPTLWPPPTAASCQRQPAWAVVDSPNAFEYDNTTLQAISAAAPNDIWAVGGYGRCEGYHCEFNVPQPFAEHWDGSSWARVAITDTFGSSPLKAVAAVSPGEAWALVFGKILHWHDSQLTVYQTGPYNLDAVSAGAQNDVWVVGNSLLDDLAVTFTMYWNGVWNNVPSPSAPGMNTFLKGVAGIASNDAWAVGYMEAYGIPSPFTMHWDGTQWTRIDIPELYGQGSLGSVAVVSHDNVWAVGERYGAPTSTLIVHWDGSRWNRVAAPEAGALTGVAAVSAGDVWTVSRDASLHWDGTAWSSVPIPGTGNTNTLTGVTATRQGAVWASGYVGTTGANDYVTLALHWNGTEWTAMRTDDAKARKDSSLDTVAVVSATDVWALGQITVHWDGTEWSMVERPEGALHSAVALSPNNIWAVGEIDQELTMPPGFVKRNATIQRWNGAAWSSVFGLSYDDFPPGDKYLYSVDALSEDDIWAVGGSPIVSGAQGVLVPLVLHWTGTWWENVPTPIPAEWVGRTTYLRGIAALAANDVWAVGVTQNVSSKQGIIEHWNGTEWSIVPGPYMGEGDSALYGLAAVSPSDVWAVGSAGSASLIIHWDGAGWSIVPTANNIGGLLSAAALSANDIWAVSSSASLHWDGSQWSVVAVQQGSGGYLRGIAAVSPRELWAVGQQAGFSSLVERYSEDFADVLPGSAFYRYVHCLACRDIVSGYPDNTYRPNNPVSRGQLSKIVSNSAGYTESYTTATFADVPVGSTFRPFIERLASRGYIGGYPCGGVGEPCPGTYLRPGASVTRGQTSKIVASAKGLRAPSPGQQTFEDVAPGSTFWQWIESLAATGAIGGYPCGGVGEPCIPPGNKPYFRPGANVTRGQSAKIVSNTFFPNCSTPGMRK